MYRYNCIKYYDLYILYLSFAAPSLLFLVDTHREMSLWSPFWPSYATGETGNLKLGGMSGCFSGFRRRKGCYCSSAKIGSFCWPRSSPEQTPGGFRSEGSGNEGFWKWRLKVLKELKDPTRKRILEGEGSECSRGSTGFQKVPEQGCQKYRLIEAIYVLSIRFVAPRRFQECYHAGHILVQRAPWACWGEEVDFDWKGWQEYLVRWA